VIALLAVFACVCACACSAISPAAQGAPQGQPDNHDSQPPQIIKQTKPVYPAAMKRDSMVGNVLVEFVVDASGKVQSPKVVSSNNPAFEQPALDAVLKWKFKPGTVDGKPAATRLRMPVVFAFENMEGVADPNMKSPPPLPKDPILSSKMPERLPYDVAPKVRGEIRAIYPYERFVKGPDRATVTVWVLVDSRGMPAQMGVLDKTESVFGYAALAACQCAEYTPALLYGKPTDAVLTVKVKFNKDILRKEFEASRQFGDDGLVSDRQVYDNLKAVVEHEAPFPLPARMANLAEGSATVRFRIGPDGKVFLESFDSSTHPYFGYMAVQAVSAWRYPPPKLNGRPVVVIADVTIKFSSEDTGALPPSQTSQDPTVPKLRGTSKNIDATLALGLNTKTPKKLPYDAAPKARGEIRPVFPRDRIFSDTGDATVWVLVDSRGNAAQMGVIEASTPEFGYAALAACQCAEYTPAMLKGKPTDAVLKLKLKFEENSWVEDSERVVKEHPVPARKAYGDLHTLAKPDVPFPISARMANITEGSASVSFFIDLYGNVVAPGASKGTHPAFAYMVAQVASSMRFPPPKVNGQPAYVSMKMTVDFSTTDEGAKTTVTFK